MIITVFVVAAAVAIVALAAFHFQIARRDLPPNLHGYEHGGMFPPHPIMTVAAQTLLPFVRSPIGRHMVNPFAAVITGAVVGFVLPFIGELVYLVATNQTRLPGDTGQAWLLAFCAAYVALTWAHWIARLIGHWRGQEVATMEAGYSWLTLYTNRLPVWLCELVLVPVLIAALAWVMWAFSVELSLWLWFGAFSMFMVAQWEQRRNLAQSTITVDDTVRARTWEGRIDRQEERRAKRQKAHAATAEPEFVELNDPPPMPGPQDGSWFRPKQEPPPPPVDDNAPMTQEAALKWLDLAPGATQAQIEEAFIRLIKRYHPDIGGGSNFIARNLNEAREVLLSR
jgi:hypothetical protein